MLKDIFPTNFTNFAYSPLEFKKRVDTFDNVNWFLKPKWLSPYVCAQWGWLCQKPNFIKCISCGLTVYLSPSAMESSFVYEEVEGIFNLLKKGEYHDLFCPWKFNPAPIRFLKPVMEWTYDHLFESVSSFLVLNYIEAHFATTEELVKYGHPYMRHFADITEKSEKRSVEYSIYLTITHWDRQRSGVICNYCNAHVNDITKRIKTYDVGNESYFSPINSHNIWCPVINSIPGEADTRPCWLILADKYKQYSMCID